MPTTSTGAEGLLAALATPACAVAVLAATALATLAYVYLWRDPRAWLALYRGAGVPCRPYRFLLGQIPEMVRYEREGRCMDFYTDTAEELGRVHVYSAGPLVVLNVQEPDVIRQVLRTHRDKYTKSSERMKLSLRPLLGDGVLMSEGAVWRRQRKLLAPAFHFQALQEMVPLMVGAANRCVAKWRAQFAPGAAEHELDFHRELSDMTLEIVATAAFGPTFLESQRANDVLHHAFSTVLQELQDRGTSLVSVTPVVRHLPTAGKRRVDSGCRDIEEEVLRVIRERRAGKNRSLVGRDLLDILLEANAEAEAGGENGMPEQYMVDEAITFVFAAFETVANGFVWLTRFLVQRPEVMARCRDEIERVLGPDREPRYEDLREMPYLHAVILESLRLYPPAPMIGKYCVEDHELTLGDGRRVPVRAGAIVSINSYVVHRHPGHWEDPLEFRPERWLGDSRPPKFGSFLAFSEGARACLGRPFAMLEMKTMLSLLLQNFDLKEVKTERPVEAVFQKLNLVPKDGYMVRLVERRPDRAAAAPAE